MLLSAQNDEKGLAKAGAKWYNTHKDSQTGRNLKEAWL